jgi:hypothetical protein
MSFRTTILCLLALMCLATGCVKPMTYAPEGVYLTFTSESNAVHSTDRDDLTVTLVADEFEGQPQMPKDLTAELRLRGNGTQASLTDPAWVNGAPRLRVDIFHVAELPANNTVFVDLYQSGELKQTIEITVTPSVTPSLQVDGQPVPVTIER